MRRRDWRGGFAGAEQTPGMGEVERKLIQSASGFLGRQDGEAMDDGQQEPWDETGSK